MLDLAAIDRVLDAYLAKVDAIGMEPVRKDEPDEPEWRRLHRIMDRAEPTLRRAFLQAVARLQTDDIRRVVEAKIAVGDLEGAVAAIPWGDAADDILEGPFMATYRDVFEAAGTVSARMIPDRDPFDFAVTDSRALEYIERRGAELVTGITETSRAAVRAALARIEREGLSPSAGSRLIMEHVGLTERLANAVQNYVAGRIAQGASEQKATREGVARARLLHIYRATMIARTEGQFAASSAQTAAWEQAVEHGLLDPGRAVQFWITAGDEIARGCKVCGPMDRQERPLGQPFLTGDGRLVFAPPETHPDCRCSRGLAPDGSRQLAKLRSIIVFKHAHELPNHWWQLN